MGYGDIYPITTAGKIFGIIIAFLCVGIVAIPTGIISAGFVEQYSRLQNIGSKEDEEVHFIKLRLEKHDKWVGKRIIDLSLPSGMIVALIRRGDEVIIPRGSVRLAENDTVVLVADSVKDDKPVFMREVIVRRGHPWNGQLIRDLNISRQTFIVMIRRDDKSMIPRGDTVLHENDSVILYPKMSSRIFESEAEEEI